MTQDSTTSPTGDGTTPPPGDATASHDLPQPTVPATGAAPDDRAAPAVPARDLQTPTFSGAPAGPRATVTRRVAALVAGGALAVGLVGGGAVVALTGMFDDPASGVASSLGEVPGDLGRPDGAQGPGGGQQRGGGQPPGDGTTDDGATDDGSDDGTTSGTTQDSSDT